MVSLLVKIAVKNGSQDPQFMQELMCFVIGGVIGWVVALIKFIFSKENDFGEKIRSVITKMFIVSYVISYIGVILVDLSNGDGNIFTFIIGFIILLIVTFLITCVTTICGTIVVGIVGLIVSLIKKILLKNNKRIENQ